MGKQRRKFETGFKQQIVSEIESGALSVQRCQPQASDLRQRD